MASITTSMPPPLLPLAPQLPIVCELQRQGIAGLSVTLPHAPATPASAPVSPSYRRRNRSSAEPLMAKPVAVAVREAASLSAMAAASRSTGHSVAHTAPPSAAPHVLGGGGSVRYDVAAAFQRDTGRATRQVIAERQRLALALSLRDPASAPASLRCVLSQYHRKQREAALGVPEADPRGVPGRGSVRFV